MPLREDARFARAPFVMPDFVLQDALVRFRRDLKEGQWIYCGFAPLHLPEKVPAPRLDLGASIDQDFRLGPDFGFQTASAVVTTGIRSSRFAPVVFWEILHVLAMGGLWIDVDTTTAVAGDAVSDVDVLAREYFGESLWRQSSADQAHCTVQVFRKVRAPRIAQRIDETGWTFGILAGETPAAATEMAVACLLLPLPDVEVLISGMDDPGPLPDSRIRWVPPAQGTTAAAIPRRLNQLVESAKHENLCLLRDHFQVTREWASALKGYGSAYGVLTFPQVYYADRARRFAQRLPDYQALVGHPDLPGALRSRLFNPDCVYALDYSDLSETGFCASTLYVARRSLLKQVKFDEALLGADRADIIFGVECHRRGIPHRVNPMLTVESTIAPLRTLLRAHVLHVPGRPERDVLQVSAAQGTAARTMPDQFKPLVGVDREAYYASVVQRFNALRGLGASHPLPAHCGSGCRGLSDFWAAVEAHVAALPLTTRDELAQVCGFVADVIGPRPFGELLTDVRAWERVIRQASAAGGPAPRRVSPIADLVAYFDEVERYHPRVFTNSAPPAVAAA